VVSGIVVLEIIPSYAQTKRYFSRLPCQTNGLPDLLMPALYRAIPVVEVDDVAVLVTHDLNFDMPRVVDKPAPEV
jgi:hypothetical protein